MSGDGLIGRDIALTRLSQALAGVHERGAAVLVVGERGIGRSACLLEARRMARTHGHLVLETAGSEAERHLPFAGLQRLLRPLLGSAELLPEAQRRALLVALGLQPGAGGDGLVVRLAALGLLARAAERHAVVIAADDVQWLDDQTRDVLAFLARRLERTPLVLLAASSDPRDTSALGDDFAELRLDRLDDVDAHRVVARIAPGLGREQRVWVVEQAVGNPLALRELAGTAGSVELVQGDQVRSTWSLPPALEHAFAAPVQLLPEASRAAVLVAALDPDAGVAEVLAATALLCGQPATTEVLQRPQAVGLLRLDETRIEFTHPLVRSVVVQREPVSRRQAAHRALGGVASLSSYRRAWHRALGTVAHDDSVAAELEATARDSLRRGDPAAATAALERAAQLSPEPAERGRRLLLAARNAVRAGSPDQVLRLLGAALECGLGELDLLRAEVLNEHFDGVVMTGSNRVRRLCDAAQDAAAAGDVALALELAEAAARRRCAGPVSAPALTHLKTVAAGLATRSGTARAVAVLSLADPVGNGRAVLSALARAEGLRGLDGDELSAYAVAARSVGHYDLASTFFDRAEVALRAHGLLGLLARNLCVAADLRLELGDWDRAAAALTGFDSLAAASLSRSHRQSALLSTAKLAALRDDTARALELVSEAEHADSLRSGSRFRARAQVVRAIAEISAGRHDEAYDAVSRVFDPDDPSHHFREQFDAVAYLAEAAAHSGRQEQARETVRRMRRLTEVSGSPALLAHLGYADVVLAADDGAEQAFVLAMATEAGRSAWQRARVQLAHGRWLRRQYRVTQSRLPLQESLATFRRLGAGRWAAEAADELEATGVVVVTDPDPVVAGLLSTQELKIARFAAQGLTNKEIGQQLYLSPRTVSSHLYRIFPKLGISARTQIAAVLAGDVTV